MVTTIRAISLIVLVITATYAEAQSIPPISEMRAKIDAFVIKSYPGIDAARAAHAEYADINSDGVPEAFVIVTDRKACGEEPCALVLDLTENAAREIAALTGREIRALQTKSGRWRDIMVDGARLRWQNGAYR